MFRISNAPELAANEVHLWTIPLASPMPASAATLAVLSECERERAAGFLSETLRTKWCVGRSALRTILSRYLQSSPDAILFQKAEHGKLSLSDALLQFNFSHSAELALLAIARTAELGVDLEFPTEDRPFSKLIERFFSASEAEAIHKLPAAQRSAAFYRCWTRKEALLKGMGAGITMSLKSFTVSVEEDTWPSRRPSRATVEACAPRVRADARARSHARSCEDSSNASVARSFDFSGWLLYSLELPAPYVGALAIRASDAEDSVRSPTDDWMACAAWQFRFFNFEHDE